MGHPAIGVGNSAQKLAPATLGLLRNTRHLFDFHCINHRCTLCAFGSRARSFESLTNCRAPPGKEIGEPDFQRFASKPDVFTPTRRAKIGNEGSLSIQLNAKEKEHGKCDR